VPNLVGKRLTAAGRAIKAGHCRTGTVRRAFSRKRKKGVVISQNHRRGQLLPARSRINLLVSRGRKH
jgi:beta-lactam-binding protein with PASTA domain